MKPVFNLLYKFGFNSYWNIEFNQLKVKHLPKKRKRIIEKQQNKLLMQYKLLRGTN